MWWSVIFDLFQETYADVGGLDQQIQEIKESVELPLTHPEYYEEMGIKPPKGESVSSFWFVLVQFSRSVQLFHTGPDFCDIAIKIRDVSRISLNLT